MTADRGTRDRNAPEWREEAACRDADPELFFPEGTSAPALLQADQARRVCQSCPVRRPCLSFALRLGLPPGIWGGASETERRDLHRQARRNVVAQR
jgi:WhiB family transcriptional regulator, redox-sensing transcriptional regulator